MLHVLLETAEYFRIDDKCTMEIYRKKNIRAPSRNRTHELPVTSQDALTTVEAEGLEFFPENFHRVLIICLIALDGW